MGALKSFSLIFLFTLAFSFSVFAWGANAQFLTEEDRARLQTEYDQIQAEIAEWEKVLTDTRSKKDTLQGDVTALNALIKKAESEIRQRNITVKSLTDQIAVKQNKIGELQSKLVRGRASLANMLRLQYEADDQSLAELVLSNENFSSFYGELEQYAIVRRDLIKLAAEVISVQQVTESEKKALAEKQNQELDARYEVEKTKKQIAVNEAEKKKLLNITKDQEKAYSTVLAERQRKAEQIRNALFPLRDVEGINFGTALEYAAYASEKTGVRTALILAILSQESDLGKNVGSCYVTNLATGNGVGKNTGKIFTGVMKVSRDTVPFERITSALGLVWGSTPVSCPVSGGYGGAMGPSQFIPSTWELYESKLEAALGVSHANPWDAKHAIMATALFMKDLGASGQTYTTERNAACRYYSGRACDARKPTNYVYGDSVLKKAESFQENIDFLKGI